MLGDILATCPKMALEVVGVANALDYMRLKAISQFLPVVDVMTSCELTSGYVFGHVSHVGHARGRVCIFVPNFVQISSSSTDYGYISVLRNSVAVVRHLGCVGGSPERITHEGPSCWLSRVKISSSLPC